LVAGRLGADAGLSRHRCFHYFFKIALGVVERQFAEVSGSIVYFSVAV
jgi:hypothetical protein